MITVLKVGCYNFALPKTANVAAILKAMSGAVQVRHCYSKEAPFTYRALHDSSKRGGEIEIVMVDSSRVGPADPGRDDHGEVIEKAIRRGLMLEGGQ